MKDKEIGQRIVPIAPDEYRTFGMDSMFPSAKVYNPGGQRYESVDRKLLLKWRESTDGQLLHEGISEAGAMASATAAGSAYSTHGEVMIPFYIFYSMFGFQRTGDSIWAMADQLARGFLIGATAGRTTLTGEGLQHADGHSPLLAATNPAVVHYDPAHAHEVAHIMQDGLRADVHRQRRSTPQGEDVIFYITVYNEPVVTAQGARGPRRRGPAQGHLPLRRRSRVSGNGDAPQVQLLASGVGFPWIQEAAAAARRGLGRQRRPVVGHLVERARPRRCRGRELVAAPPRASRPRSRSSPRSWRTSTGPFVAVSDYMRAVPLQIAQLDARRLPRARHRRLRLRRHPPGRAALLPGRRRVRRRAGAAGAGRRGAR